MKTKCEVIGWVHDDVASAKILILEENGRISAQSTNHQNTVSPFAVQTGAFLRGERIIDPVTRETLGYEMERISNTLLLA